jgi:hypothetical protein
MKTSNPRAAVVNRMIELAAGLWIVIHILHRSGMI